MSLIALMCFSGHSLSMPSSPHPGTLPGTQAFCVGAAFSQRRCCHCPSGRFGSGAPAASAASSRHFQRFLLQKQCRSCWALPPEAGMTGGCDPVRSPPRPPPRHTHTWRSTRSVRSKHAASGSPCGVPRPAWARSPVSDRKRSAVLRGEAVAAAGRGVSDLGDRPLSCSSRRF